MDLCAKVEIKVYQVFFKYNILSKNIYLLHDHNIIWKRV